MFLQTLYSVKKDFHPSGFMGETERGVEGLNFSQMKHAVVAAAAITKL
jgi:hypothetical protein